MLKPVDGCCIDRKLLEVLGLPDKTIAFSLRVAVGEIATVECRYYPELAFGDMSELTPVLAQYELHQKREQENEANN